MNNTSILKTVLHVLCYGTTPYAALSHRSILLVLCCSISYTGLFAVTITSCTADVAKKVNHDICK